MTIPSAIMILLSAVLHAAWNVLLKREQDPPAAAVAVAALACVYALALGLPQIATIEASSLTLIPTLAAGVLAGLALWAQGQAFRSGSLSLSYTIMRAGQVLFLWPVAVLFLGEEATTLDLLGVSAITIGLSLITLKRDDYKADKSIWWSIAMAIFVVAYNVCYKITIDRGANPFTVLGASDVIRVILAFILLQSARLKRVRCTIKQNLRTILIMSLCSFGSFSLYLFSLKLEGAAHMATFRNLSILFTAVAATKMGERLSKKQFIAIVICVIGAIILGLK